MVSSKKYMISSAITSAALLVALLFALFAMNPSLGWFSDSNEVTATGMQVKSKVSGITPNMTVTHIHSIILGPGHEEVLALEGGQYNIDDFIPGDILEVVITVRNDSDEDVNISVYLSGNKDEKAHVSLSDEYLWLSTQLFVSTATCTGYKSGSPAPTAIVSTDDNDRAYLYPVSGYDPKDDDIPTNITTVKSGEHYCEKNLHEGIIIAPGETCTLTYQIGFVNSDVDQEEFKSDHFNGTAGKQPGYFAPYFVIDYSDKD